MVNTSNRLLVIRHSFAYLFAALKDADDADGDEQRVAHYRPRL